MGWAGRGRAQQGMAGLECLTGALCVWGGAFRHVVYGVPIQYYYFTNTVYHVMLFLNIYLYFCVVVIID